MCLSQIIVAFNNRPCSMAWLLLISVMIYSDRNYKNVQTDRQAQRV